MPRIELIDNEYIGVSFQYDRSVVQQLRHLSARHWNPEKRRWEIHIAHLADVMKIFHLRPEEVPPDIVRLFQSRWIKTKLHVRAGNSFTQIEGGQLPLDAIDAVTSFPVYGHQFDLRFLDGRWDGRKHLLDRRNFTFPTGLLQSVLDVLHREGVDYEIENLRGTDEERTYRSADLSELTDYQKATFGEVMAHSRGLLELAPGAGKWILVARLLATLEREVFFIAPTPARGQRAVTELSRHLKKPVGYISGATILPSRVTVIPLASACRAFGMRIGKSHSEDDFATDDVLREEDAHATALQLREAPTVIFDAVHAVPADTCYQLIMRCVAASRRYGISAVPHRSDGHDMLLEAGFGPFIHRLDISALVDCGAAVPARIVSLRPDSYPPCERDRSPEEIHRRAILTNENRHALVVRRARQLAAQGRRVIVLVFNAAQEESLRRHLAQDPSESEQAHPKKPRTGHDRPRTPPPQSHPIEFATLDNDAVLDEPSVNAVVFADAGVSETKTLERVCRCLRPHPGKTDAVFVDFLDPVPYLKERSLRRMDLLRSQRAFHVTTEGFTP